MNMVDYLEQAKKEIRDTWFKDHKIKSIEGENGFQRIRWGEEGTRMYQVDYVLSGNMIFISGDLGDAAYSLTCSATLDNIKKFDMSYFTGKLTAHQREKYDFDDKLARKQIKDYFLDWCNIEKTSDMEEESKDLFNQLISETLQWNMCQHFSMGVYAIYQDTNIDWFDSESASCIADCGSRLSYSIISYWVGLKMIIEQLEQLEKLDKESA
ncbi:hypothetical protein [Niallia circulans]|uniref:Uncharacterized protein n=1 Tax=Niallia circulans TaxID=1397 RepID=A0A941GAK7_NIACI|nr:hypothetical protein [Niallia circulans]MCB5235472.1 hypothetical protein [Niallia circulans]